MTLVAGNSRAGFSGDGGPAVNAQLNGPQGIALDSAGNIYIADSLNNRVRMVNPQGIISTFAGNGQVSVPGFWGDSGPATDANIHLPVALAVDSSNNVYIAASADNTVRIVTTDGIINIFAGAGYKGYYGDYAADSTHRECYQYGNGQCRRTHRPAGCHHRPQGRRAHRRHRQCGDPAGGHRAA